MAGWATKDWGQTEAYTTVKYVIDWWADEDPTKSYVRFIVNEVVIYSTSRYVPTHRGRWIIGPWPARWGGGYRPHICDGKVVVGMQSNSQARDYVYCDLLSASFRPYTIDYIPPGVTLPCLKLRAIANTYDQAIKGVAAGDVAADHQVLKRGSGDPDTAWAATTCSDNGTSYDCEVRVDWSKHLASAFAAAKYTPSTKPPPACTQDPIHLGICPGGSSRLGRPERRHRLRPKNKRGRGWA